jgi:two-component system sensor histidine kinase TctE
VVLRVCDNGPVIPAEALPHLFDPFAPARAGMDGAELGLAVTHQLVARHRGRIGVETGEQGTIFEVELPQAALEDEAVVGAAA